MSDALDSWQLVGGVAPSDDLKSAKVKAKALDLGSNCRWSSDPSSPGNGVTRAGLVCNNHVQCGFKLLVKRANSAFNVYWKGQHSDWGGAQCLSFGHRRKRCRPCNVQYGRLSTTLNAMVPPQVRSPLRPTP